MPIATPATPATVRLILETELTDPQLQGFIDFAALVITQAGIDVADCHTDGSITQLHIWLSAHFAYIRTGGVSAEKMGDAQETRRAPTVLIQGIPSTYYGQAAISMDCSGLLTETGEAKAVVTFIGGAGP